MRASRPGVYLQGGVQREKISGKGGGAMKDIVNAVACSVAKILDSGAVKATKYLSPKLVVKVKRKEFKGRANPRLTELHVTFGVPNYEEREFIKACRKSGEPFPVGKIQLKFAKPSKGAKKAA
ncbi:hypothetical protein M0Q28_06755 [Patescibacteria group bacterium]|jgi:hypothetical protein|nr:hypothetical protein [Patescibacteria group bacterium]